MSIKRKAAVGAIAVLAALAPVSAFAANFSDVPSSYWGYGAISWAADNGVVVGYGDGTFRPEQQVTEAEFLAMLLNAYHPALPNVEKHHWADQFYAYSKQMNYPLSGYDDETKRDWIINRQRVAEIVTGAAGYNYTGRDAIQFLLGRGLAKGEDPGQVSIESFHGEKPLTRAEAVAFVKNLLDSGLTKLQLRPQQPSDPKLLPPLPGQQPTQPQPPVQPPTQPTDQNEQNLVSALLKQTADLLTKSLKPSDLPRVDMNNWTPGDSTVLGKALFSNNFKFNNDGTVTVTIPTVEQLGQTQGALIDPYYKRGEALTPGKTYTLQGGNEASLTVNLLGADGNLVESYTVSLDGSGKVGIYKRVNGQLVWDITSFAALLRGLGVQ